MRVDPRRIASAIWDIGYLAAVSERVGSQKDTTVCECIERINDLLMDIVEAQAAEDAGGSPEFVGLFGNEVISWKSWDDSL